ncbi:hypothetical protein GCM10010156_21320 [Planobispora rosea]|uniref:Uncharacterized protein n=1 Tax=Planobispora rosea TaxID=35762 RepID=A0A8J3S180_PLARO|nr:hypothetical protein [Planobispora rosea]GGS62241.1 hypothetical protein GCM10010156_21320 [Planobispora rosea]GIH84355.1 hypothetical protein Pro02_27630 [Planobispora rosea]
MWQAQDPAAASRERHMQRLCPAVRDRGQSMDRTGQAAGDRGDGVGIAAQVDRGAQGVLVAAGGAQRPYG